MSFTALNLHPTLLRAVEALGFIAPTPIQRDAIPPVREGRDVLACAMTGSGKTAAFVLPIVERLMAKPRGVTRALVIAPTRELAAQIEADLRDLARFTPVRGAAVFGGVGMGPQEAALRRGVDVIVATPGRLLDHMQYPYARLEGLEVLVLDEADRMLDMGFLPDIRRILGRLPRQRQTLLFSATMPAPIAALAREFLRNPLPINQERKAAPATGITHAVYPVAQELKSALLQALLRRDDMRSVLAFTRTKHRCNRLAEQLARAGIATERIHGNRSQGQRTVALDAFKRGKARVLVATDIAARGIDIDELSHVVNFDVPHVAEDYIHRAGRTARAGAVGEAVTFVAPDEMGGLRAIERALGASLPRLTLAGFDYAGRPAEKLEVPLATRVAAIRARRADERARARGNAFRRDASQPTLAGHRGR
ncbi:MAG TPA: DEAD/DEAH box helicase [Methylomirabilota bacterium]|nr:DEAD/DEAH box helicase [Methylomirabilota bacterium]